jgi:hypothetical protein
LWALSAVADLPIKRLTTKLMISVKIYTLPLCQSSYLGRKRCERIRARDSTCAYSSVDAALVHTGENEM